MPVFWLFLATSYSTRQDYEMRIDLGSLEHLWLIKWVGDVLLLMDDEGNVRLWASGNLTLKSIFN